jgi:uncharacterized damage-inducible protein DinB
MEIAEIKELFAYNAWANRRMFDALAGLPADVYRRDVKCSFGSIHGTLAHIVGAERLWLSRWRGEPATMLKGSDVGSLAELRAMWDEVETERDKWLEGLTPAALEEEITITSSSGGRYVHGVRQTLQHVVDHSSYHRGQIVTMLRQLGVKPPSTGMIGFLRQVAPR